MNKYEALFHDILERTRLRELNWKQLRRGAHSDVIFNPNLVFRQFSAEFPRDGENFALLLVEKKYEDPEHDFAFEKYVPEILIMDEEGELITTLTDSVIERRDLMRLADMVEAGSDKASKLFGSSGKMTS
jgi:hypothetical protein